MSLGIVVSHELNIKLNREYKRHKDMMIKWFEENLDRFKEIIAFIEIDDTQGNPIELGKVIW